MASPTGEILGFIVEWYDPQPMMTRQFLCKVFVDGCQVELQDIKLNKCFLRKCAMPPSLRPADFFVGAKVVVLSRLLTVVDYADAYTKRKLSPATASATVLLGPDAFYSAGAILTDLTAGNGFKVSKLQSFGLKEGELADLLPLLALGPGVGYEQAAKLWCSGCCVAVELKGEGVAEALAAGGLLARLQEAYGRSALERGVWHAPGLGDFFFGPLRRFPTTATLADCSACVVRPHAVKAGHLGPILATLLDPRSGFEVTAMQMFQLDKSSAAEFLEVYDGVMPSFKDMVDDLCTGPLVALEVKRSPASLRAASPVSGQGDNGVVAALRDFVGPWDVEMAVELRPSTIRAKFGVSRTQNAVHVTDLADDGEAECAYFFDVLQGS